MSIATNGGADALVQVVRLMTDAGLHIDDIGLHRPTLDDVFLALTGHAAERSGTEEKAA